MYVNRERERDKVRTGLVTVTVFIKLWVRLTIQIRKDSSMIIMQQNPKRLNCYLQKKLFRPLYGNVHVVKDIYQKC